MPIGDDAAAAGYSLVSGTSGLIKDGDTEINLTRDYIARVKALILAIWPITAGGTGSSTVAGARANLGICGAISYGTATPVDGTGADGDVYFKYIP